MIAVILAAGEGRRMLPLTIDMPKPLLPVSGRPILERIIDALPEHVTEVVMVVGYHGDLIQTHFGGAYNDKSITYVQQEKPKGTYDALLQSYAQVGKKLSEKFLLLNADDLHGKKALEEALAYPLALIASHHDDPTKFGVISRNEDGTLREIIEKPESAENTLVSTGAMVLDERIFNYEVAPAINGEFYLPTALQQLAAEFPVQVVEQTEWIPIGYPEDLAKAEELLNS